MGPGIQIKHVGNVFVLPIDLLLLFFFSLNEWKENNKNERMSNQHLKARRATRAAISKTEEKVANKRPPPNLPAILRQKPAFHLFSTCRC